MTDETSILICIKLQFIICIDVIVDDHFVLVYKGFIYIRDKNKIIFYSNIESFKIWNWIITQEQFERFVKE